MVVMEFPDADHSKAFRVNPALMKNPKYEYLFKVVSKDQVFWKCNVKIPLWCTMCWVAIFGCWLGLYPRPIMVMLYVVAFGRWAYAAHDSMHAGGHGIEANVYQCPLSCALFMPCLGFTPITETFRDLTWLHIHNHHKLVKSVLDNKAAPEGCGDWDARWSSYPLYQTIIGMFIWPGHHAPLELLWQWFYCPAKHWPERIMTNSLLWAQLYAVYKMDLLISVLIAGHIGSFALYLLFHGLTHRKSYYEVMMQDPTGCRHVWWIDPILNALLAPGQWDDMKFHDVHHAFSNVCGYASMSFMCRFYDYKKVLNDVADMVDEGVFVDKEGTPFNHLSPVGYQLGDRKKHLDSNKKTS